MPHITTSEASVDERHFASKERCAGGPLLSALIVIIVAVVAEYQHLLWILLFIVGYRFFQDYLLGPAAGRKSVTRESKLGREFPFAPKDGGRFVRYRTNALAVGLDCR